MVLKAEVRMVFARPQGVRWHNEALVLSSVRVGVYGFLTEGIKGSGMGQEVPDSVPCGREAIPPAAIFPPPILRRAPPGSGLNARFFAHSYPLVWEKSQNL